jgi:hypothetical protein
MHGFSKRALIYLWFAGSLCLAGWAQSATTIRAVSVVTAGDDLELQISASQPVTPQAQILINPYRLVIDFPNSSPGADLRNLSVNHGDVKGIRVGLFGKNPPVTRVVLDLKAPVVYQVSASGQDVTFKLSSASRATAMPSNVPEPEPVAVAAVAPPKPRAEVFFNRGLMTIHADNATLADVLIEVRRKTGADIQIPPGADQEQVFSDFGPASARDVMSSLLNGTRFNFVVVGSASDPNALRSLILTPKAGGASMPAETSSAQDPSAQPQFPNVAQRDARQEMHRQPDQAVQPQMPAEQEDPGDTPPPDSQ